MSLGYAVALVGFIQLGLGAPLHAQAAGGGLPPGKCPVGFTRFTAADSTRGLKSGQPRLVDVGGVVPRSAYFTDAPYLSRVFPVPAAASDDFLE